MNTTKHGRLGDRPDMAGPRLSDVKWRETPTVESFRGLFVGLPCAVALWGLLTWLVMRAGIADWFREFGG